MPALPRRTVLERLKAKLVPRTLVPDADVADQVRPCSPGSAAPR